MKRHECHTITRIEENYKYFRCFTCGELFSVSYSDRGKDFPFVKVKENEAETAEAWVA